MNEKGYTVEELLGVIDYAQRECDRMIRNAETIMQEVSEPSKQYWKGKISALIMMKQILEI